MGNKGLDYTALVIAVIGAVNWGLIGFLILFSQAVRAVGNHHGRNPESFHAFRVPEIGAGTHGRLFFQSHFPDQFLQLILCHTFSFSAPGEARIYSCQAVFILTCLPPKSYYKTDLSRENIDFF